MKDKQYKFYYQVEGQTHTPWLPSYICWGKTQREAARKARRDQEQHWTTALGHGVKVIIKHGSSFKRPVDYPFMMCTTGSVSNHKVPFRDMYDMSLIEDPFDRFLKQFSDCNTYNN